MTWEKLEERIDNFYIEENVKIPYSHYDFDREVEPPHLMSTEINDDNFLADDRIYFEKCNTRLELTTDFRDRELEKRIQKEILKDIIYKKEVAYIQSEKIWNTSYFFEIIEEEK